MSAEIIPTVLSVESLRDAVRRSRGWYKQIVRDTGCRYSTLSNISKSATYVPRLDEAEMITAWFARYGVPTHFPTSVAGKEARLAAESAEAST